MMRYDSARIFSNKNYVRKKGEKKEKLFPKLKNIITLCSCRGILRPLWTNDLLWSNDLYGPTTSMDLRHLWTNDLCEATTSTGRRPLWTYEFWTRSPLIMRKGLTNNASNMVLGADAFIWQNNINLIFGEWGFWFYRIIKFVEHILLNSPYNLLAIHLTGFSAKSQTRKRGWWADSTRILPLKVQTVYGFPDSCGCCSRKHL